MAAYPMKTEEKTSFQRSITVHPSDDEQVSVIRKEFVALTGNHFSAVVLNQLLYWTLRVKDFDLYLEEEKALGLHVQGHFPHPESHHHGWIYKTATDLSEETLLGISKTTMRKYLKLLIDQGWVEERANTLERWKKTTQYRVNIRKLQADLTAIGRQLPGCYLKAFSTALEEKQPHKHLKAVSLNENTSSIKNPLKSKENSKSKTLPSKTESLPSKVGILSSKTKILPSYTYTENTTKTTNREHTQDACALDVFDEFSLEEILRAWETCTTQRGVAPPGFAPIHLTKKRKQRLQSVLGTHFQNDLTQWKQFCERVGRSSFLMGHGPRKWRVSLDWVLCEENLLKVLEGNFDDPDSFEQKQADQSNADRTKEINSILASIEDPIWREWCSQLNFSSESWNPVSLGELKSIAHARFLEVEDDRLVWIGSSDTQVLSRIEDLRLKILPIVQRTFPHARTVRTRMVDEELPLHHEEMNFQPLHSKFLQQQGGISYAQ